MNAFANKIFTFIDSNTTIIIAVVAIALFINGAALAWPNERSRERAKEALPWVAIGCAVAISAVSIAKSLGSGF